ncbi:hypothetical protein [uncultured Chloroflexus sp.]|uniref:hypothetical protein n=1 Tax=uncultured Chloroflexus sp. TaxID=214040 RepID=UPI002617B00B|nr:hypothetical protein [uncultured Chloroflexus sp.]
MKRLILLVLALALLVAPMSATAQSTEPRCFPDVPLIDYCLHPSFVAYWSDNGGLPVFGYPISPLEQFVGDEGRSLTVQWTERNRLELHPGNPPAYRIQIGRMGAEALARAGRDPFADPPDAGPQPGCLWFPETGHNVCDQEPGNGFRTYWQNNGLRIPGLSRYAQSLALFGYPLTAPQMERNANGDLVLTQWFERARFEWHPQNPARSRVLLGLLGRELYTTPQPIPNPRSSRSVFGVEINRGTVAATATQLAELGADWVRYNAILWDEVEPTPGARNWTALRAVEAELLAINAAGAVPMVIVRNAPAWARAQPDKPCGPIRADALPAFAAFLTDVVARYSQPPYNVKFWELGNEPDVPFQLVSSEPFGCWGDELDEDGSGGAAYAAMLKVAYPAIKTADPQAQVIFGGLMLDCPPDRPLANGQTCRAGRFFEAVLSAGGGDYFDILAYHAYSYFGSRSDPDRNDPKWGDRGGSTLGRANYLRATLAQYGYAKPLIMNEGALLCYRSSPNCRPNGFEEAKADAVVRLYARTIAADLLMSHWYTLNGPGWQEGGLLDSAQQPLPAFRAFQFARQQLGKARYLRSVAVNGLEGYHFRTADSEVIVVWSIDGVERTFPLPANARAIYDATGNPLPLSTTVTLTAAPRIIVIPAP